jgi:hypothetical protein
MSKLVTMPPDKIHANLFRDLGDYPFKEDNSQ